MTTTADELIAKVKLRCHWPVSGAPLSNAQLLSLADDEIVGWVHPLMLAAQGDYHTTYADYPITAGQARYRMPRRMFGPIKKVLFVDGDTETGMNVCNLAEIGDLAGGNDPSPTPYTAFIDGDFVGLYPTPQRTEKTLRIRYYKTPGRLSLMADSARIEELVDATHIRFEDAAPDVAWAVGVPLDFICESAAHQVLATIASTEHTDVDQFAFESYPDTIEVGDYVGLAGYSPLVQAPDELVPLLIHRVALQALNAHGDQEGFARVMALATGFEAKGKGAIEPRSESEPRVVISRSSPHRVGLGRG